MSVLFQESMTLTRSIYFSFILFICYIFQNTFFDFLLSIPFLYNGKLGKNTHKIDHVLNTLNFFKFVLK